MATPCVYLLRFRPIDCPGCTVCCRLRRCRSSRSLCPIGPTRSVLEIPGIFDRCFLWPWVVSRGPDLVSAASNLRVAADSSQSSDFFVVPDLSDDFPQLSGGYVLLASRISIIRPHADRLTRAAAATELKCGVGAAAVSTDSPQECRTVSERGERTPKEEGIFISVQR